MMWKQKAADQFWLGVDHQPESSGFVVLPKFPVQIAPVVVLPNTEVTSSRYINECTGAQMRRFAVNHYGSEEKADATMQWLRKSMKTGQMPYRRVEDEEKKLDVPLKAQWGAQIKVGIPGVEGDFLLMEADEEDERDKFWDLPAELLNQYEVIWNKLRETQSQLNAVSDVRYQGVSRSTCRLVAAAAASKAAEQESSETSEYKQAEDSGSSDGNHSDISAGSRGNDVDSTNEVSAETAVSISNRDYGADRSQCKVGSYAIMCMNAAQTDGSLEIVQITSTNMSVADGCETFDGIKWGPPNGDTSTAKCLTRTWNSTKNTKKKGAQNTLIGKKRKAVISDDITPAQTEEEEPLINTYDC